MQSFSSRLPCMIFQCLPGQMLGLPGGAAVQNHGYAIEHNAYTSFAMSALTAGSKLQSLATAVKLC